MDIKCVFQFFLQLLYATFLTLRIGRGVTKNVYRSPSKIPVILVRFWSNFYTCGQTFIILRYQIWWKSIQWSRVVPCGVTDRQTDMTNQMVVFRNFANATKKHVPKYLYTPWEPSWPASRINFAFFYPFYSCFKPNTLLCTSLAKFFLHKTPPS